jgi:hypothetical protein
MTFKILRNCIWVFLLLQGRAFGQAYNLPNEAVIFSFDTYGGKKVTLNKDTANKYIIYRFGTGDKIEFEFPGKSRNSWDQFKYSFYLRGGGTQNEGMELNYIYFVNKGFKYIIYDTYFAVENKKEIGIKIINLKTRKTTNVKGDVKTRKGTLAEFRDNNLLEIEDEVPAWSIFTPRPALPHVRCHHRT